MSSRFQDIAI